MGWRLIIPLSTCLVVCCSYLSAQRVYYCEPYSDRFTIREDMLGKVGNYYWVETTNRRKAPRRNADPSAAEERYLAVYDTRMNLTSLIGDVEYLGTPIKEYLITNEDYFDQVHLLKTDRKHVAVWLERWAADGQPVGPGRSVGVFPFDEPGNSFVLVRSADRCKILVLGFEFLTSTAPRVHALLFDQDWQLLSDRVFKHPFLTQPMIQDDYSGFALEDFNSAPVKLANNGEWLMATPSRSDNNFLLFHFNPIDTIVAIKVIWLPSSSSMEDVCLSIDNARGEAVTGILSTFHYSTLKNVQVVHYSMAVHSFDFDSSYRLATLGGRKVKNDNLVKESFMAVPGKGFLLMKEYGRPFENPLSDEESYDEGWDPALLFADNGIPDPRNGPSVSRTRPPDPRFGYARYSTAINPEYHDRGDLSLYYFPASRGDSCWTGMISQEQVTEMNSPNLSYTMVPTQNKLFFLYNSFVHGEKMYASTTVINRQGELVTNQGIPFWGLRNTLDFQQSRQMGPDQVVIPYERYDRAGTSIGKIGFAVVLFGGAND